MKLLYFILTILTISFEAHALREARATAIDSRLRVLNYSPYDVFKFEGFYGYQSSIELARGESVEQISMGDTMAWQIVPIGHRIFLKPIEPNATTNMTVITNIRTYHFELHAKEVDSINDPDLVFTVQFLYSDDEDSFENANAPLSVPEGPDLSNSSKYNFNYTISGSELIAPIKIFDDGEFTYFEFRNKNAEYPAFFKVNRDNTETLVNYRISGNYVIVEQVASRFTLRMGKEITCVYNESDPHWLTK